MIESGPRKKKRKISQETITNTPENGASVPLALSTEPDVSLPDIEDGVGKDEMTISRETQTDEMIKQDKEAQTEDVPFIFTAPSSTPKSAANIKCYKCIILKVKYENLKAKHKDVKRDNRNLQRQFSRAQERVTKVKENLNEVSFM